VEINKSWITLGYDTSVNKFIKEFDKQLLELQNYRLKVDKKFAQRSSLNFVT
jgi:hypothetical protein